MTLTDLVARMAGSPERGAATDRSATDATAAIEVGRRNMPITLLDGILVGFTLVSAMLAMVRGFSREVLSIVSWVAAAAAAFFFYQARAALRSALCRQ